MSKITRDFIKRLYLVWIAFCINFNDAKPDSIQIESISLDFEQIKSDLFLQNSYNFSTITNPTLNAICANEMDEIKNGLQNSSDWSLELIDTWAKLPSTVSSVYSYEFGKFSQCFNIKRHEKVERTQYCMGQLVIEQEFDRIINLSDPIKDGTLKPEFLLPQPAKGVAINFGLCLPRMCSLRGIEPILNYLIQQKQINASIKLFEDTCQTEEIPSEFKTIDLIAIIFLGTVLCLVLASTFYDVSCTLNRREKSQLFLAFSFYTNGKNLFSVQEPNSTDTIRCIDGIRAISAICVVLFHQNFIYSEVPRQNYNTIFHNKTEYFNLIFYIGLQAVDTFFVLSGLLLSIGILKKFKNGRINVPLLYFHRYIRLTPLLGVTILVIISPFRFTGSGPLWSSVYRKFSIDCEQFWWTNLIYAQNYMNPFRVCNIPSWYLAVDMQLFLITPPIIYFIYRFKTKAIYTLLVPILVCMAITVAEYRTPTVHRFILYNYTHLRCTPWLIGVIAGYVLLKTRNKNVNIPKMLNIFAWTLSFASMIVISHIQSLNFERVDLKPIEYGLYLGGSRIIWSISLCYIIFACVHNYGGFVNWFLAHPFWKPISKLSFSIYLIHFVVIYRIFWMKTSVPFSEMIVFYNFFITFVISLMMSIIANLAFEAPMTTIANVIFKNHSKAKTIDKDQSMDVQQK
ncbi:nose resistant to fluoxetine protein 6-like isoform X2 [Contarinia nasturtii]|uniref:nose resistant to fluoxetine protein 6-like isoform X2 n=1 Tax=Contarinia nasturtii TaxID=265458 RepID=UPI0012D43CB7|nr:nose resistant to fluoxetine protein 6-like isoform X2 [Contarinia nasturtii]